MSRLFHEAFCAVRSIALLGGPSVRLRHLVSMKPEEDPEARVCPVNGNVAPDCTEHQAIAPFLWNLLTILLTC